MQVLENPELIKCRFGSAFETSARISKFKLDIFYGETQSLLSLFPELIKIISSEEKEYSRKLTRQQIRETYIVSHALLRLYLAMYLNLNPEEIVYNYSIHNKPGIEKDPVYFNLSHTNGAFAIAVSSHCYVGIDIEEIVKMTDINSVVNFYFSKAEQDFIFGSVKERESRFFLLWTRKESFLKALGTGIINDLGSIEVSKQYNDINRIVFDNLIQGEVFDEHYIFSTLYNDKFISVTVPLNPIINLFHIQADDITGFLCK